MENNSGFMYPREGYWLFCDSTFLAGHQPSDPALDFEGKEMRNNKNEPVYIRDVDLYQDKLAVDSRIHPWWAGDLTTLNGYYFEEEGGNFCYGADDLGATATLQKLVRGSSGKAENGDRIWAVILCPEAFSNSRRPASYRDASNAISVNTNFATVIPRSTTLLHEAFHLLRGGFFDSGDDEICKSQPIRGQALPSHAPLPRDRGGGETRMKPAQYSHKNYVLPARWGCFQVPVPVFPFASFVVLRLFYHLLPFV